MAASLALMGRPAHASFTMADLIAGTATGAETYDGVTYTGTGDGVIVGDKLFASFGYLAAGDMPGARGVQVVGIQDTGGDLGLRFQGGFGDSPFLAGPSDALITYTVTVLDPSRLIVAARHSTAIRPWSPAVGSSP